MSRLTSDLGIALLIGTLGGLLVVGYVVLASLGRDTTGYVLFLGGPAVTALVGAILSHRVAGVATAVETNRAVTQAVVAEHVGGLDAHLESQDGTLQAIHDDVHQLAPVQDMIASVPAATQAPTLPVQQRPSGAATTDTGREARAARDTRG